MTNGTDTAQVNGIRVTLPTSDAYHPAAYGPQTTGVPQVSPTIPPFLGGTSGAGPASGTGRATVGDPAMAENVDGYGTAGNNNLTTQLAHDHPYSLKVSPVWWVVAFMVVGVFLLRVIHWRGAASTSADL